MKGHIRRRGKASWELKFDGEVDPATGKRATRYRSFKGTKRAAEAELIRLLASASSDDHVDPSKTTLSEFLDRWQGWVATQVAPKTQERYRELADLHVRPHLGATRLQRLRTVNFAELYGKLQKPKAEGGAGLAPRTVGHVHRLIGRVLGHAIKWGMISINPVAAAEPPRVEAKEIEILAPDQVASLLVGLRGDPLHVIATLALATGLRRGELLALRWADLDLDRGIVRVERSLEQTKGSLRFKSPKSKAGRRSITIPPSIVAELRRHWRVQQEQRLALGLGKGPPDALVIARHDGSPLPPDRLSLEWSRVVRLRKLPKVTLHALRHTHASQLIAASLDVVSVSRRLGHGNPSITLSVYSHLFGDTSGRAASVVEAAMASALATE